MGAEMIASQVLAWSLVVLFALVLGGQTFDAFVLVPIWSGNPPDSIEQWLGTPAANAVPRYFSRLLPALLFASVGALAVGVLVATARRGWLVLAGGCGLTHMGLVMGFFVPTNRALGFLPTQSTAGSPDKANLVRRWLRWNYVRIALDLVGLVAAVHAVA